MRILWSMMYSVPSQWAINGSMKVYKEKLRIAAMVCWIVVNSQNTFIIFGLFPSATRLPTLAPTLPVTAEKREMIFDMMII